MSIELDRSVFTSLYFATVISLQSKVITVAPNPQPEKPSSSMYIPQRHDGALTRWQSQTDNLVQHKHTLTSWPEHRLS
jgi:hypothetical protein